MKCLKPLRAQRTDDGSITFKNAEGQGLLLPCGQCIHCRLTNSEAKALRMVHESMFHEQNCFVTLTYSDEKLPLNSSFDYSQVTKFIKRLRKAIFPKTIRYFKVGEYGEKTSRPHYHLCIFGYDFSDPIKYKNNSTSREIKYTREGNKHYTSQFLDDCWSHGICEVTDFNFSTAMYSAKYSLKKVTGSMKDEHYSRIDPLGEIYQLEEEKSSASSRPAIGLRWIEKYYQDVYPKDFVTYEGKKFKPPKYYDLWLEKNHPSIWMEVKIKRENSAQSMEYDQTELTRIYGYKLEVQKNFKRRLSGDYKPNKTEERTFDYLKNISDALHLEKKEKL